MIEIALSRAPESAVSRRTLSIIFRNAYPKSVNYPNVKHAHIVPRSYLTAFAENELIGVRIVGEPTSRVISTAKAGTRRRFYRRTRPDGTTSDDVEWSLSKCESATAPILRSLNDDWPLSLDEKAKLAELFAYQVIRGPRWKDWHGAATRGFINERRCAAGAQADEGDGAIPDEVLVATQRHLLTDTQRMTRMLSMGPKVATVVGSMHWSLVEFAMPVIATSDHPVVLWPLTVRSRRPQPTPVSVGILECLEIRVPVSPRHVILMTWADRPDSAECRVRGSRHHASNFNAFSVAEADRQWFHLPHMSPPVGTGQLLPVSPELSTGYRQEVAESSRRRAAASELVQPMIGDPLHRRNFSIIKVT